MRMRGKVSKDYQYDMKVESPEAAQHQDFQNSHASQYVVPGTVSDPPYHHYVPPSMSLAMPPDAYHHDPLFYAQNKCGTGVTLARRELFALIHEKNASRVAVTEHAMRALQLEHAPHHVQLHVKQEVSRFYSRCMSRWKQCKRIKDRFVRANAAWLSIEMKADDLVAGADQRLAMRLQGNVMDALKQEDQQDQHEVKQEPLPSYPTRTRMDHAGRSLRALPDIPPEEPPKPRPKMSKRNAPVSYTPEEVLDNLIVKANLSKRQYEILRDYAVGINCFIYPSFSSIQKVMKERVARGLPLPHVHIDPDSDGDIEDSSD